MNTRPSIVTGAGSESMMKERLNMPALLRMDGIAKKTYVWPRGRELPPRREELRV